MCVINWYLVESIVGFIFQDYKIFLAVSAGWHINNVNLLQKKKNIWRHKNVYEHSSGLIG